MYKKPPPPAGLSVGSVGAETLPAFPSVLSGGPSTVSGGPSMLSGRPSVNSFLESPAKRHRHSRPPELVRRIVSLNRGGWVGVQGRVGGWLFALLACS